jgi:lipopolysaccharide/colanic/teichoic acid biosynthesis glycosyltransferase
VKRLFDFFVALLALLTLLPVLLVLYVIIAIKMGIPVFFVQARPGMKGNIFKMVKFRSMTDAKGADGELLPDAQRLPAFGQMLRATSLDEIPELWNVLKGQMSLVGPRPLLIEYLDKYSPEQARRHNVRPGVTGWAQVNGRNALSWEDKFALDTWYVDNRTFLLDIKILFMTVKQVFKRDNISQDGHVTMEKFKGSE